MVSQPELPDAEPRALALEQEVEPPLESERARQVQPVSALQQRLAEQQGERLQPEQWVLPASESELPRAPGRQAWQRQERVQPEPQVRARLAQ